MYFHQGSQPERSGYRSSRVDGLTAAYLLLIKTKHAASFGYSLVARKRTSRLLLYDAVEREGRESDAALRLFE